MGFENFRQFNLTGTSCLIGSFIIFLNSHHVVYMVFFMYKYVFRDGCRPFLEVYNEDRLISPPLRNYESMHLYMMAEGKVLLYL